MRLIDGMECGPATAAIDFEYEVADIQQAARLTGALMSRIEAIQWMIEDIKDTRLTTTDALLKWFDLPNTYRGEMNKVLEND